MHTLGHETVSGGDLGKSRCKLFQRYFHRRTASFADQVLMIGLFREVVHASPVS